VADLGIGQVPRIMTRYPHMMSEDVAVWTDFLKINPDFFQEVWYDVHVGSTMPLPLGATELQIQVAMGVSRKRIDVIGRSAEQLWVIEIKPYGNMVALGQVITYHRLFVKEFDPQWPAIPVIICANLDPDLTDDLEVHGVGFYETEKREVAKELILTTK